PAVESQAADRVYRIGQKNPVTVYRLNLNGTVEEKIRALQDSKRQLADNILENAGDGSLTRETLLKMFEQ
ncbi:MAG: DEAD/DEAH box helicase, partial [Victivallales bacterium]|nr:DEAD/DEAH box helicase [Victivallales bacterium]